MDSPKLKLGYRYTWETGTYTWLVSTPQETLVPGAGGRKQLLKKVYELLTGFPKLRLHMQVEDGPLFAVSPVFQSIACSTDLQDWLTSFYLGEPLNSIKWNLEQAVGRWIPMRRIPGTQFAECPVCGGGGTTTTICYSCDSCTYKGLLAWWMPQGYLGCAHDGHSILEYAKAEGLPQVFIRPPTTPGNPWMPVTAFERILETLNGNDQETCKPEVG